MHQLINTFFLILISFCFFTACEEEETIVEPIVVNDEAIADETQTADWLAYGRTHNERRFDY